MSQLISEQENSVDDVINIGQQYGIETERLMKGYSFAIRILDGESASSSYMEAFEVPYQKAKTLSSQLYRAKWIQSIITLLEIDTELRDRESMEDIKTTMSEIMENSENNSEKISAARVLKDTIVSQKKEKIDIDEQVDNRLSDILKGIKMASESGTLIREDGEIIDVGIIE